MTSTASPTDLNFAARRLLRALCLLWLVGLMSAAAGCAHSPTDQAIEDQSDLQLTVQTFHRDMRWRRWESASMVVAPDKRAAFLARYDALGDDFHISNIEIKALERLRGEVVIELEQESYTEPAMIVEKKRYIEVWKKPESNWFVTLRMPKDDYKKMKKMEAARERRKSAPNSAGEEGAGAPAPEAGADAFEDAGEAGAPHNGDIE